MPRYTVWNRTTEQKSNHTNWQSAFRAASKHKVEDDVVVVEKDKDGQRIYNLDGKIIERD